MARRRTRPRTTPREQLSLLAEAALPGKSLEEMTRPLLAMVSDVTGLSSSYLTEIHMVEDEQLIHFSYNGSEALHVPEDIKLPWSLGLCKFALDRGNEYTERVSEAFPDNPVGVMLSAETFVSMPLFHYDGHLFGTLCAVDDEHVSVGTSQLNVMRLCARLLSDQVSRDDLASRRRSNVTTAQPG